MKRWRLLFDLAEEVQLSDAIEKMFSGDANQRDGKPRRPPCGPEKPSPTGPIYLEGRDVMPDGGKECSADGGIFGNSILSGAWRGYTG